LNIDCKTLIREAIIARENAYAPYSDFLVGAALLTAGGKIYRGCNIENAAYTPTNCAERTAFFTAAAAGEREFIALAVVGWKRNGVPEFVFPCGVCRQVMMEFCSPETFTVITAAGEDKYKTTLLRELLPSGFGPANLSG